MRTLTRDKKPLYICKRVINSEPRQFEQPKKVELNIVTTNSQLDVASLGNQYKEYRKATISIKDIDKYNEGDRAYIYVEPPLMHDLLCETCDFEIVSISCSISQATILFKRLQIGKS